MFDMLLESVARPQRRAGGSVTSVAAHAALIAGAVFVTARPAPVVAPREVAQPHVIYVHPHDPAPQRAVTTQSAVNPITGPAPVFAMLHVPVDIPVGIPPIDFSAAPTDPRLFDGRASAANVCRGLCVASSADTSATWVGTDAIMQLRDRVVPPRYPEALRSAGIDGRVVVKFVVDTLGRVEPASFEVVESTHALFTAAVRETVLKLRFNPATNGTRKIAAAAMMPFEFTLR